MAFTIPETIAARTRSATPGERKVFVALRDHLPEDYLVYYDVSVKGRHPDFLVIGPDLGLVALEVKDWRLGSIADVTADGVRLRQAGGDVVVGNPMQQVRGYTLATVDLLKERPRLRDGERLACAWGYAVVFPSLKGEDVQQPSLLGPSLEEALEAGRLLTADDLSGPRLLPRLRALLPRWAGQVALLAPDQIDEIRGVLYPEIRIGWGGSEAEIMRVMDREQDRLARTLGEGHRLLRGVTGSGKTICLICRTRHLCEQYPDWRILVLCFNAVLAGFLRQTIEPAGLGEVRTFHAWCLGELKAAGITVPAPPGRGTEWEAYWDRLPRLLLDAYAQGRIPPHTWQAILVDEGQDFADDWYRALLHALDPATNSLFVALDSSQNIYKRRVSWKELGLQVVGHTRVLRVNYRNTRPILAAAYRMIEALDAAGSAGLDSRDEYVVPEKALRGGPAPVVRRCASPEASREHALEWIRERLAGGAPPEDILVLGPSRPEMEALRRWLTDAGVAATLLRRAEPAAGVQVSTIHSAKGLDADHVLLTSAHQLQQREDAEARRLLYIAMTRTRKELCVTYHQDSALMAELERACRESG